MLVMNVADIVVEFAAGENVRALFLFFFKKMENLTLICTQTGKLAGRLCWVLCRFVCSHFYQ